MKDNMQRPVLAIVTCVHSVTVKLPKMVSMWSIWHSKSRSSWARSPDASFNGFLQSRSPESYKMTDLSPTLFMWITEAVKDAPGWRLLEYRRTRNAIVVVWNTRNTDSPYVLQRVEQLLYFGWIRSQIVYQAVLELTWECRGYPPHCTLYPPALKLLKFKIGHTINCPLKTHLPH